MTFSDDLLSLQTLPSDEPTRVDDVWFTDGNLILQAENSLFRIYGGIISARSSVFRDMLAFPPPAEGNATFEGCPIVEVYDSAVDMTYFLRAVLDSRCVKSSPFFIDCLSHHINSFFEPPPSPSELPIVSAVLRLSTKYDIQYLRRRALQHLITTFPMTLAGWKARDKARTIPPVDNTPFAALQVAREFDLPWLIPSIMYCISSHPLEKTLDGAPWAGSHLQLSHADQRTCVLGRSNLMMIQNRGALELSKTMSSASESMCTEASCVSTRMRCAEIMTSWGVAGFLDFFEENSGVFLGGFCSPCHSAFRDECEVASQALWNALPPMFDLPSWDDLDKLRVSALD